jgi:hypothetical protein
MLAIRRSASRGRPASISVRAAWISAIGRGAVVAITAKIRKNREGRVAMGFNPSKNAATP